MNPRLIVYGNGEVGPVKTHAEKNIQAIEELAHAIGNAIAAALRKEFLGEHCGHAGIMQINQVINFFAPESFKAHR
ncbi:MAG: hypothetical protein ABFD81_14820 [Syntrophaceae bacterium]